MNYKFIFILLIPLTISELILLKRGKDLYCISSGTGTAEIYNSEFPWQPIVSKSDKVYYTLTNITEKENCKDFASTQSISLGEHIENVNEEAFIFSCDKKGYFGSACDLDCKNILNSSNCINVQVCNSTHCSCLPGYHGKECRKRCGATKYGAKCEGNCSENCKPGFCHVVNGNCKGECKEGWKGENCKVEVETTTTSTTSTTTSTNTSPMMTTSNVPQVTTPKPEIPITAHQTRATQAPQNPTEHTETTVVLTFPTNATMKQQDLITSQPTTKQTTMENKTSEPVSSTQSSVMPKNELDVEIGIVPTTLSIQNTGGTRISNDKTGTERISTENTGGKMTPKITTILQNKEGVSTTISTQSSNVTDTPENKSGIETATVSTTISTQSSMENMVPENTTIMEVTTVSTTISTQTAMENMVPENTTIMEVTTVSNTISTQTTVTAKNESGKGIEPRVIETELTAPSVVGNEWSTPTAGNTEAQISSSINSSSTTEMPIIEPVESVTQKPVLGKPAGKGLETGPIEIESRTEPIETTKSTFENGDQNKKISGQREETTTLIVFSVLITFLVFTVVSCLIFGAKRRFVMKHLHRLGMTSRNNGGQELFPMYARDVELETQDGDLQYFLPNAAASAIAGAEILTLAPVPNHSLSVAVSELRAYVEDAVKSGALREQHALFPRGQTQPWEEGQKAEHRGKNRYLNLYAYDHTRVYLTPLKNDPNSHYINANFIDGYEKQREYIATQGPNKMTISDFWRMVWQEEVTTIVMLANVVEDNKPKCEQYWPDVHKEIQYGTINIRNKEENVFLDYTIRNFIVSSETGIGQITRKIRHLHYTVWPDHGVVKYPHSLADFIRRMMDGGQAPFVVHCSAGVGRTGTVILSHACYQMAKKENRIDCLALVGRIRSQRANLVDRVEQYQLVHQILIELLVVGDTRIPKEVFQTQLAERMEYGNGFMNQFQLMNEMSKNEAEKTENISWPAEKSRFPSIIPGERGRVILEIEPSFINAVTVNGLKIKDKFIVTQLPLPETLNDFWNMVVQEQACAIILLNEPQPSIDTSTSLLWLEEAESPLQLDAVNVTAKQCSPRGYGDVTTIQLEYSEVDADESMKMVQREISVLRVKGWQYGVLMHGAQEDWVNLCKDVEMHRRSNLPIVVACHDGATASGLFASASYLFENIEETGMVDVVSAVRNVRHNRPQFIAKYEQFEFLYEIASEYLNTYEIYANSEMVLRYSHV